MRPILLTTSALMAGALALAPLGALAAKPKHPAAAAAAPAAAVPGAPAAHKDTVVATVNGNPIHLSDLDAAAQELPQNMRQMSAQQLYPLLVDQLIDREALVLEARKEGLQKDPAVQAQIAHGADTVISNALIRREVAPLLTDAALHSMYDKQIGVKPGDPEVQASHILVASEDAAKKIIAELKAGADFATLAKKESTDPSGAQNGGDLGFFKKADMLPEFSDAAFALQPGQYTQTPVKTRYGWHVIKVVAKRLAPPPTFSQVHDQLQQQLIQQSVQAVVEKAKKGLVVQRFNSDGTPASSAPAAVPVAPPGPAPVAKPAPVKK